MRIIKMRSKLKGNHVHTTFFIGNEGQTLINNGTLVQDIGDWQLFGTLLMLGEDIANRNYPRIKVIPEGDEKVIEELSKIYNPE